MIKNGVAEGMVTRKLCVEVLDLVLTSFQTSFFSAPTVSKVQITDMLLLSTSFFSYPLPRSHRQGGFEKKMFPSTSYSFLFQIKAVKQLEPVQPDRLSVSPRPESSVDGSIQLPKYKMYIHRGILQMSRQQHYVYGKKQYSTVLQY